MRADVVKFLFLGVEQEKQRFFTRAQEAGVIEFFGVKSAKIVDEQVQKYASAIKILRRLPVCAQIHDAPFEQSLGIATEITAKQAELIKLHEQALFLEQERVRVHFFGQFSLEDVHYIEKKSQCTLRFFVYLESIGGRSAYEALQECSSLFPYLLYLGEEAGFAYFTALVPDGLSYELPKKLSELKVTEPVGQLHAHLRQMRKKIKEAEEELHLFATYNHFLHEALVRRMDEVNLQTAVSAAQKPIEERVFASQGWVPSTKVQEVRALCREMNLIATEVAMDPDDIIPTYLENQGVARLGEDLVHIYDTPSITDKDPSLWVFGAFSLFFAMIINDAGYGLVLFLLLLLIKRKFPILKGLAKRVWKLGLILSCACMIWGIATASFFSIELSTENPLRQLSFVDYLMEKKAAYHIEKRDALYQELVHEYPKLQGVEDPNALIDFEVVNVHGKVEYPVRQVFGDTILFEFALLIGVVHMILSMIRNSRRNVAGLGWVIFMVGAYLYFPLMLHTTSLIHFWFHVPLQAGAERGMELIAIGGIGACILALIQKRWAGALEAMTVIQIFCDALSYLRLYALGLAGLMMGMTFNELASGVTVVLGVILVILGHTVNLAMSIMGGLIHGLRLNFLEWYHYSFEGGGKMFKPLQKISLGERE